MVRSGDISGRPESGQLFSAAASSGKLESSQVEFDGNPNEDSST